MKSSLKLCLVGLVQISVQPVTVLPAQVIYGVVVVGVGEPVLGLVYCSNVLSSQRGKKAKASEVEV